MMLNTPHIVCDHPDCWRNETLESCQDFTVADVRRHARELGWRCRSPLDFCPEHAASTTEEGQP